MPPTSAQVCAEERESLGLGPLDVVSLSDQFFVGESGAAEIDISHDVTVEQRVPKLF